jgi:hypothetical protein
VNFLYIEDKINNNKIYDNVLFYFLKKMKVQT